MSGSNPSNGKPAVLVVDNDAGTLVAIQALLDPLDCRVATARSGVEAVERARTEAFAAIVMDVRMPGLDGFAAASFIRQHPRSSATPILFFSGEDLDLSTLTQRYGHRGRIDSVRKPIDAGVFRSKIDVWLDLYRSRRHVNQLEQAVDAAETEARSKDDVLAMVAHDLRGPLSALKTSFAAVRRKVEAGVGDGELWDSVRHHFDLGDRVVDRMSRVVNDLVDGARVGSTGFLLDLHPQSVDEIVAQTVELLSPLAEQRAIRIQTRQRGTMGQALCDRDRILQVLSNLTGNAIKFTPPGGHIVIDVGSREDQIELCVSDTGPGIAPDQLPHIFDKYWQGNRETGPRGLGLGLTIAKEIIVAHRGRIWVTSQLRYRKSVFLHDSAGAARFETLT